MLAQARYSQTVSKRGVFPGFLSLGEYPGGTTFLSPWAGGWGEPGTDLQQASLTVVVGSCGPKPSRDAPGKDPPSSSATAFCPHFAVFLVSSSSLLSDGRYGSMRALASQALHYLLPFLLAIFPMPPVFSPPFLLRILALASAFSSGCLSTKCGGYGSSHPPFSLYCSTLQSLLFPPWSTGETYILRWPSGHRLVRCC